MIVDKYGNYVLKFMWQLCGRGRVDICMTFEKRAFDFFYTTLHIDSTIFKIARQRNVNSILPTQLPHKFSYIVAILIHNHFETPSTINLSQICI
jgi:hypothetical protein